MTKRIDAQAAHDGTADQVCLRRETHEATLVGTEGARSRAHPEELDSD